MPDDRPSSAPVKELASTTERDGGGYESDHEERQKREKGEELAPVKDPSERDGGGYESDHEERQKPEKGEEKPRPVSPTPAERAEQDKQDRANKELERRIEELQVQTCHNMVVPVDIPTEIGSLRCRFLYLKNGQADMKAGVQTAQFRRMREELELQEPKLIIRLMSAAQGRHYWQAYPYWRGRYPAKRTPEVNIDAEQMTEHQMLLLAKEVILPLAMSTDVLVAGSDSCSLTAAFIQVSTPIQNQLRDSCRFRLVIFARAYLFEEKAIGRSIAAHFRQECREWKDREIDFNRALTSRYGTDRAFWPMFDLPVGRYSIVMFECLADMKISDDICMLFENDFLASFTGVPTTTLMTLGTERMKIMPMIAEHIIRGSNLLLIDSRRRTRNPKDMKEAKDDLKALAQSLHDAKDAEYYCDPASGKTSIESLNADSNYQQVDPCGVADWFTTDTLAFVKSVINRKREQHLSNFATSGKEQHRLWLHSAIDDMMQREARAAARRRALMSSTDDPMSEQASRNAELFELKEEQDLIEGTNIVMGYVGGELEWEMTERHRRFDAAVTDIRKCKNEKELSEQLKIWWLAIRGCAFHDLKPLVDFATKYKLIEEQDNGERPSKRWMRGSREFVVSNKVLENNLPEEDFKTQRDEFVKLLYGQGAFSKQYDEGNLTKRAFMRKEDTWLAIYDILKSESVFTCSMTDLAGCHKQMEAIARIDYLPQQNSLQALVLLRRAWTLVDLFHSEATWYKKLAKSLFAACLILGSTIVFIVTVRSLVRDAGVEDKAAGDEGEKITLLTASLLSSVLTGVVALIEPTRKWMTLRGAELAITSEIWKFRTRMGEYTADLTMSGFAGLDIEERECEYKFRMRLQQIQQRVQQGSSLHRTKLFSTTTTADDTLASFYKAEREIREMNESRLRESQSMTENLKDKSRKVSKEVSTHFGSVVPGYVSRKVASYNIRRKVWWNSRRLENYPHLKEPECIRHKQFDLFSLGLTGDFGVSEAIYGKENPLDHLGPPEDSGEDNYHSPATPEDYIMWRLIPLRDYYQGKVPWYACLYKSGQIVIMVAAVLSAFLAAVTNPKYNAIVSSVSSIIGTMMQFRGIDSKLDRYSSAAESLESILIWWQSCPDEDKKVIANIQTLVMSVEDAVLNEAASWFVDTTSAGKKPGEGEGLGHKEPEKARVER